MKVQVWKHNDNSLPRWKLVRKPGGRIVALVWLPSRYVMISR